MEAIPQQAWQYGAIGVVAVVFALAVVYLFKYSVKRDRVHEKERAQIIVERASWATERARIESGQEARLEALHAEYEEKYREIADRAASDMHDERGANRAHEDAIRHESAELMEGVSAEAGKSAQALVELLQKFYDRFVGPRSRY